MLLRNAKSIGELIADRRRRLKWSQSDLAERIGASRYWVSEVENGKTTVEADLVLRALQELGYAVHVRLADDAAQVPGPAATEPRSAPRQGRGDGSGATGRRALTRGGKPLRVRRSQTRSRGADES